MESSSRRVRPSKTTFSDKLSKEAKIAMKLSLSVQPGKDQKRDADTGGQTSGAIVDKAAKTRSKPQPTVTTKTSLSQTSFNDLYEEKGIERMKNDITDDTAKPFKQPGRRPLDPRGKLENATEIVETVVYGVEQSQDEDDQIIEAIAKQNAVDKCEVWMVANFLGEHCKKL